jgi:3-deoxy-D-manno-octulosonic-acid transferase
VLALPLVLVNVLTSEKRKKTVLRRLGIQSLVRTSAIRPVWVHALSVGEVLASVPLVKRLRKTYYNRPLVFSISTLTGHEMAKKLLVSDVDSIFFFPYDFLWSVRKAIRNVTPSLFFLVESDIWPNFLYEMKRRRIPTILVNGRISPRSFSGYKRLSFFMRSVFSWISVICAQSELDAERFESIGAPQEKIRITGNLKFDQEIDCVSSNEIESSRQSLKIAPGHKILVAGSTHEGEESIIFDVFCRLKRKFHKLVLVIVPRNPERASAVCRLAAPSGRTVALMNGLKQVSSAGAIDVIVVDTMGVLGRLYALADIAFVGGSLVRSGGHNPLEPAALGKPILFGPDMSDFSSIAEMLIESGGAIRVSDGEGLFREVTALLGDNNKARRMGERASEVFQSNRGAVERTLKISEGFLKT